MKHFKTNLKEWYRNFKFHLFLYEPTYTLIGILLILLAFTKILVTVTNP